MGKVTQMAWQDLESTLNEHAMQHDEVGKGHRAWLIWAENGIARLT